MRRKLYVRLWTAHAEQQKPNILVIVGDDVGWFNNGAYHRGIMSGKTPNLDQLAAEGMMFTDYYAEASCTAGRAALAILAADTRRAPARQVSAHLAAAICGWKIAA